MANSKHFSLYCLIVCFALILPTYSAANALTLPIDIEGFTYHAQLNPNTKLTEKIQGISANSASNHYAGRLNEVENSWVRLSNIDGKWQGLVSVNGTMHIIDEAGDSNSNSSTLNALNKGLNSGVLATPASAFNQELGSCGATPHPNNSILNTISGLSETSTDIAASLDGSPISAAVAFPELCAQTIDGVCMLAEVEFAFDLAFQSLFGSNASSNALAIINNAEGYYRNDLEIGFDTITVEMLNSNTDVFSTTTDVYALLDDISLKKSQGLGFVKNNKALLHFITGRDFDGGVVGLAWIGTVCGSSYYTTGISQVVSGSTALTALVATHELGHNFGASHDGDPDFNNTCTPNTNIMGATLNATVNSFSSCSIGEIKEQIDTGTGTSPNLCFNFPINLSITASANNPTTVQTNTTFASQYTVSVSNGYQSVSQLQIQGSLNANEGEFDSVRANGNACSLNTERTSYTCQVDNPSTDIALDVEAHAFCALTMNHSVSDTSTETVDMNPNDDTVNTSVMVTEPCEPPPAEDPTPSPSTTSTPVDDGGGSMSWWILMLLLTAAVCQKTPLRKITAHTSA